MSFRVSQNDTIYHISPLTTFFRLTIGERKELASVPRVPLKGPPTTTHRQEIHASPIRKVFPVLLFVTEPYLQSSISSFIHLTQRGVSGTHFFG